MAEVKPMSPEEAELIRSQMEHWAPQVRSIILRLLTVNAALEAECFHLSAGTCEHLTGDPYGNPTCTYREQLYKARKVLEEIASCKSTIEGDVVDLAQKALKYLETERSRGDALAGTLEAMEHYQDKLRKDLTEARRELCEEKALTMSGMWDHPAKAYADTRGWADLFDEEVAP